MTYNNHINNYVYNYYNMSIYYTTIIYCTLLRLKYKNIILLYKGNTRIVAVFHVTQLLTTTQEYIID